MTTDELLDLLFEAQKLLNEATNLEDRKRIRIRREGLQAELARCYDSALRAHEQASSQLHALGRIVERSKGEIETVRLAAAGRGLRPDDNQIYDQLAQAVADMSEAHQAALKEIEDNRQRSGAFSITLFGRTMTGKSTLMEILTRGDGSTIGRGAQRATRDTREYDWNGLRILDVPGVAAFGGSRDEQMAYEAAQQADLILFLITDDAPQPADAEHLARLRRTGNPVLGICNVKRGIDGELGLRRFLKAQDSLFSDERLACMVSQFQEMQSSLGAGQPAEFKHAHLLARFLADQPDYQDHGVALHAASRFADIEDHIYQEVTVNGTFHRKRSFLESTSRASYDIWDQMLIAGTYAWQLHDRIRDHARETRAWREGFRKEADARIQGLLNGAIGQLRAAIPEFMEANCEDTALAKKWGHRVQSAGINERVRKLQQDLHQQVVDKVKTLIQEMEQEFQGLQANIAQPDLTTGPIRDHRRIWNWSARGISSALGIASLSTGGPSTPPGIALGIAAMAVGVIGELVGRLFSNKSERRQESITRITTELHTHLDQLQSDTGEQLRRWLRNDLIGLRVNTTISQLEGSAAEMAQAAGFYGVQSASLNQQLLSQNRQLVGTALEHIGIDKGTADNLVFARVPGQGITIMADDENFIAPGTMDRLESVLQEPIYIVPGSWTAAQIIQWGTDKGTALKDIRIDWKRAIAHAPHDDADPATAVRISMVQQLTGLHIRNSN